MQKRATHVAGVTEIFSLCRNFLHKSTKNIVFNKKKTSSSCMLYAEIMYTESINVYLINFRRDKLAGSATLGDTS